MPQFVEKKAVLKIDDDSKTVTAKFATLGVIDLDGDVVEKGSIGKQNVLMGAYNHNSASLPPGLGKTYETKVDAMFEATFFDTPSGDEHYRTLKAVRDAGGNMEWSFRFFVEEAGPGKRDGQEYNSLKKLQVAHVAPVEKGAGIDTRTVDIKSCGPECQARKAQESQLFTLQSPVIDYEKLAAAIAVAMGVKQFPDTDECNCVAKALAEGMDGPVAEKTTDPDPQSSEGTENTDPTVPQDKQDQEGEQLKGQALGDLIRSVRDDKELSNEDLATAAGLSVASIGGILAGTTGCPKVAQLQGLARRLGINLSKLVAAAEEDGCGQYEDGSEQASTDDDGSDKSADEQSGRLSKELSQKVDALLSGFPGLGVEIDPGLMAWTRFEDTVLAGVEEHNND